LRVGAFDLRVTRQARGAFDEAIDHAERLRGVNGSLLVARGPAGATIDNVYLDPFWIHSEHPASRAAGRTCPDERDTCGQRLRGRRGDLAVEWTLARQVGRSRQLRPRRRHAPLPSASRATCTRSTRRRSSGPKRSVLTEAGGIPIGLAIAGAKLLVS
jgi:hypothetical protein